ncbi:hypothetical protein VNO80_15404 [Phaseolus coccineus]|uniref:Uncharacterized protein n=1 Tax=Phaseolus coccineus TaxID=3886 RepID=A0AAN9MRD6_PHACN
MALVYHPQASSFNAARTEIQLHEMRVRTIHENQMRIERKRERASSYGSHYESSDARRERKRGGSRPPAQKSHWNDLEAKRKRRVAKYNLYEAEGKAKSSLKEGLYTFKQACMKVVAGFG